MTMGYISNWSIQRTAHNFDCKLILFHDPKFLNDLKLLSRQHRLKAVNGLIDS